MGEKLKKIVICWETISVLKLFVVGKLGQFSGMYVYEGIKGLGSKYSVLYFLDNRPSTEHLLIHADIMRVRTMNTSEKHPFLAMLSKRCKTTIL